MSAATDNELMTSVQRGEIERLGDLFERHHRRLYGLFVRLTNDRSASEDLVQELFVRMLKYRNTFRPDAAFLPWMYALARNVAIDFRRTLPGTVPGTQPGTHAANGPAPVYAGREELEARSGDSNPHEALEREETKRTVDAALARLAPDKREVLVLARFAELRYEQIAEIVGSTAGNVKVRVHRAMAELRADYLNEPQQNRHGTAEPT